MSCWAHISGIIRIDTTDEGDLGKVLGEALVWEDGRGLTKEQREKRWAKARRLSVQDEKAVNLPCGSEGSLEWKYFDSCSTNFPGSGSFDHGTAWIALWGDLRDFGSSPDGLKYVRKWFGRVVRELDAKAHAGVGSAVLTYESEWLGGQTVLTKEPRGGRIRVIHAEDGTERRKTKKTEPASEREEQSDEEEGL